MDDPADPSADDSGPGGYPPPPWASGPGNYPPPPWASEARASAPQPGEPRYGPGGRVRAEWWRRVAAYLVDSVLLGVVAGPLSLLPGDGRHTWMLFVVYSLIAFPYYGLLNGGRRGQTVGKIALAIQVRDNATGGPIGPARGMLRYVVPWIALVLTVAVLVGVVLTVADGAWPLWDPQRQALHDKLASSTVLDAVR